MENFDLAKYLTTGVENLVNNILRATLKDPKESAFMMKYSRSVKEAAKHRAELSEGGEHIPPFLIASITSSCNLHCTGCYARHNQSCCDSSPVEQLSDAEWLKIFHEAKELGISFILLAGGEPMLRRDVIRAAGSVPEILFPIFTNGTMIDDAYLALFQKHRNLVPVFSIEGHKEKTDSRRGEGVYKRLIDGMERMQKNHLIFGASVTVTRENLGEVFSHDFVENLNRRGCKVIFYVEYVPVSETTASLAPTDEDRARMEQNMSELRASYPDMIFIAFPGDEKSTGGCLAAGRGFFHINSHGGAEPCPFSPYSDINVRETSLREALKSDLFRALQSESILTGEHIGGCVLFEQKDKVAAIIERNKQNG
ncbi:MAG: radical SAM protein [Clostridia bacterium]|nr:radical SAM protein [Clostridia bacterium]